MTLAEQAAQAGDVELALDCLATFSLRLFWSNPDAATRQLVVEAAERLPLPPDHPRLVAILGMVAPVEWGAVVLERLPQAAAAAADQHSWEHLLGEAAAAVGKCEQSSRILAAAVAGFRAQGEVGGLGFALVSQAWTAICLGNWMVAAMAAAEASHVAEETRHPRWMGVAMLAQAAVAAAQGEYDHAETLAAGVERSLLATGAYPLLALVQLARGLVALGQGRHAEAYDQLRRMYEPTDLAYHPHARWWAASDFLEAALHSNHLEQARAVVAEMEALVEQTHAPLLRVHLAAARPLLAEEEDAEALYRASLDDDLAHWPFLRARLQLTYGVWLRRQRRVADSRAPLRAALETFQALGAGPWGERARQELRASGEVRRARTVEARQELSPQELQIAQLAAEGLSNHEIGQRLYLSHRTVSSHLYRLFPKLGITSRAELHAALAGERRSS